MKEHINNIVIIGAGQLGSRHLQSIKNTKHLCDIWVVDSSVESLHICEERYTKVDGNTNINSIKFCLSIDSIPKDIDFLLIATSSAPRYAIFEKLSLEYNIKNILFEKVLFQKIEDYYFALKIIRDKQIKAWINCPRRMFDVYHKLKEVLNSESLFMIVDGGNWGLACNSIHFIDLYNYLSNSTDYSIDTSCLDSEILNSKRYGYKEITGTLKISFKKGGELILSSRKDSCKDSSILISSPKASCIVLESENKYILSQENKTMEVPFIIPFQSQLTSLVLDSILSDGVCDLIDYETSMKLHIPFIEQLTDFINKASNVSGKICPIT